MSPAEYGRLLAQSVVEPLTNEQVESAARILAAVELVAL